MVKLIQQLFLLPRQMRRHVKLDFDVLVTAAGTTDMGNSFTVKADECTWLDSWLDTNLEGSVNRRHVYDSAKRRLRKSNFVLDDKIIPLPLVLPAGFNIQNYFKLIKPDA